LIRRPHDERAGQANAKTVNRVRTTNQPKPPGRGEMPTPFRRNEPAQDKQVGVTAAMSNSSSRRRVGQVNQ